LEEDLRTRHLRGWIEPIEKAVPRGSLTPNGHLPPQGPFNSVGPVFRLTEAGWQAINQTHRWVMTTLIVALATLVATILGIIINANTN
jgi:hypothetical protein